jgi:hypothetical protein
MEGAEWSNYFRAIKRNNMHKCQKGRSTSKCIGFERRSSVSLL